MPSQLLNLPFNVPWQLIGVSQDMMDTNFCNKRFPFEWRSSIAISAFEPELDDLSDAGCERTITYLKLTCTITGYQPSREETERGYSSFSDFPAERLDDILQDYFACYGVLLNVAVFPFAPDGIAADPIVISFGDMPQGAAANPLDVSGVRFNAAAETNQVVDFDGDQRGELLLGELGPMTITFPPSSSVRLKVFHEGEVRVRAFRAGQLLSTHLIRGSELTVEGNRMDRIVIEVLSGHAETQLRASLIEFICVPTREVGLDLFPHIIDFEPKTRDLYQGATEDGEVLTASNSEVKTEKSFTRAESSENGLSFLGTVGKGLGNAAGAPTGGAAGAPAGWAASLSAGYTRKWGDTAQDATQIQTDASRDRRERYATSTNLTQMYNLLTGYHAGTNRAVFLMLPRPHVLQATDRRTFVQGVRAIEGVQDFFLIVERDKSIPGLCVEASLETGHFPENVQVSEPEPEYDERFEEFVVTAESGKDKFQAIETFITSRYTIESGWIIDRRQKRQGVRGDRNSPGWDPGHPGIKDMDARPGDLDTSGNLTMAGEPNVVTLYNYQPLSDSTVQVSGRVGTDDGVKHLARNFKVFTRSERPRPSDAEGRANIDDLLITSRSLCVCVKSGNCFEVVSITSEPAASNSIVDERPIRLDARLLTREETAPARFNSLKFTQTGETETAFEIAPALLSPDPPSRPRLPAQKEMIRKIASAMTTSARVPTRIPFGEAGFLDTDHFKNRVRKLLPAFVLGAPLASVPNLSSGVVQAFAPGATVDNALDLGLAAFARRTGLPVREAAQTRFRLLTFRPPGPG